MQPHANAIKQDQPQLDGSWPDRDGVRMRWDHLFDDLAGQVAAAEAADLRTEVADRTRAEHGTVLFADRLRGADGHPVSVAVLGAGQVTGTVRAVGIDWLLLGSAEQPETLLALRAVLSVAGLGSATAAAIDRGPVHRRLDLRQAMRALAGQRSPVRLVLTSGLGLTGTPDRVGADFVELAVHPAGEPRRRSAVTAVHLVPLGAIGAVRRLPG